MTQRTDQVAATLKRAVQEVLSRGLSDPRVRGLITVTRIEVTADLADAKIHVSVIPAEHEELSMHGLKAAATWIRRESAERVRLRRMPRFTFKVDQDLRRQQDVLAGIQEARLEDERRARSKQKE